MSIKSIQTFQNHLVELYGSAWDLHGIPLCSILWKCKDTYEAFKPQTATYDPNSWYWTVWHIDQMAIHNQDLFGKSIQNHWKALEEQLIIEQKVSDAKYAALKADEAAAKAVEDKVTEDALARSERLFKQFKQYESELSATLKRRRSYR